MLVARLFTFKFQAMQMTSEISDFQRQITVKIKFKTPFASEKEIKSQLQTKIINVMIFKIKIINVW